MNLIDNGVTISNDKQFAETLNKYTGNIAKHLLLPENSPIKE